MATIREQVLEFHKAFNPEQTRFGGPGVPSAETVRLRLRLIFEEAFELLSACSHLRAGISDAASAVEGVIACSSMAVDMPGVADALADLDYVVEGSRLAFGIDGDPIAAEVHRSNMSKVGGHRRADGKWVKPPTYSPADIEGELYKQGWRK